MASPKSFAPVFEVEPFPRGMPEHDEKGILAAERERMGEAGKRGGGGACFPGAVGGSLCAGRLNAKRPVFRRA